MFHRALLLQIRLLGISDGVGGFFHFDFKLRLQYRDGSAEDRILLLEEAIKRFANEN